MQKSDGIFFFFILSHLYVGSTFLMKCLHWTRSCTSSPDISLSDKSYLMLSNHLPFFSPAPPSPSLSCPHILLLFSIHANTTLTYFCALSWIFLSPSLKGWRLKKLPKSGRSSALSEDLAVLHNYVSSYIFHALVFRVQWIRWRLLALIPWREILGGISETLIPTQSRTWTGTISS